LSGTFDTVPAVAISPNQLFAFAIKRLELLAHSPSGPLSITGSLTSCPEGACVGRIAALVGVPDALMNASVSIDGQTVDLGGGGPFSGDPPTFSGLEVCGAPGSSSAVDCEAIQDGSAVGYDLAIFATGQ